MENFKKDVKLFLNNRKKSYSQKSVDNIFDLIFKLCSDRFLSDRFINSLWNDIDDNLVNINLIDKDLTYFVIDDLIKSLKKVQNIAIKYEEFESAKNVDRFSEIMIERAKNSIR